MALKIVHTYADNGPARNYAGTGLVAMESPCPYSQWDFVQVAATKGTWTYGAGCMRFTCTDSGFGFFTGIGDHKMLYTGPSGVTLTGTISSNKTGTGDVYTGSVNLYVDGNAAGSFDVRDTGSGGPLYDSAPVPYYRYRIRAQLYGQPVTLAVGDWVQIDFTLS